MAASETDEQDLRLPGPYGCTFLDEMWRIRTVSSQPPRSRGVDPTSPSMLPVLELCHYTYTVAQRAFNEDREISNSCLDIDEYEQKRQALYDKRRAVRDEWMQKQPSFPKFSSMPPELRHRVWRFASEEHTRVSIAVSKYYEIPIRADCGGGTTPPSHPLEIAATASLPPLMLVNSEAHSIASRLYRRSFCGTEGRGGVLAAYPTILTISGEAFQLFPVDHLELVTEVTLTTRGDWWDWGRYHNFLGKLETLLFAPNLKRFVGKLIFKKSMTVWLCKCMRVIGFGLLKAHRDMPEVVIEIKDLRGFEFHFQGSPDRMPKISELRRAGITEY